MWSYFKIGHKGRHGPTTFPLITPLAICHIVITWNWTTVCGMSLYCSLRFFSIWKINKFCLKDLNYKLGVPERIPCRFLFVSKTQFYPRFDVFVPCFKEGVQIYRIYWAFFWICGCSSSELRRKAASSRHAI